MLSLKVFREKGAPMQNDAAKLGLAAAALALIALPIWKHIEKMNAPRIGAGPEVYVAAADSIDLYWRDAFAEQYPNVGQPYRSPRVRFDDIDLNGRAARDMNAGFYIGSREIIHVDVRQAPEGAERAYTTFVLSHEFGHHIQNLSGMQAWTERRRALAFPERERQLGVRYELQAECISGVWARDAAAEGVLIGARDVAFWRSVLASGEHTETHGSGAQRRAWFDAGYESGDVAACDTFTPEWERL